jgi:sec-independent protein translocase protein TatB
VFDIAFTEMVIIAVVALVVLGPERLPRVAKQAGQWMGKLQRYVSDVKADINRQMELEELRKLQSEVTQAASSLEGSIRSAASETQSQFDSLSSTLSGSAGSAGETEAPRTDWDKIYAVRRSRDRIVERRTERAKTLGLKVPKRRR